MYKIMYKINSECSNMLDLKDTVPSLLLVTQKALFLLRFF